MKTRILCFVLAVFAAVAAKAQATIDCSCMATQTVLFTNSCQGIVPDMCQFTNCITTTVVPPPPIGCSQTPAPGTVVGPGSHPITITITDASGAVLTQCVVNFTVNAPPAPGPFDLLCASNKVVYCDIPWTFDPPTPTNYCCPTPGVPNGGVSLFVINLTTNGTCPAEITQTWMARDACGKVAFCSQTVTQVDIIPPIIICASNQTVQCGTPWSFGTPSATDNCTAPSDLSYALVSTTTNLGCGNTMVASQIWNVHDLCGNLAWCTQTVTVVDTVAPILSCAPNKTVQCGSTWTFDPPTASDACSGTAVSVSVFSTVTNGFCPQTMTRTWIATDPCGNSAQCSQTVTVVDTTPPLLDCNCLRNQAASLLNVVGCSNAIPSLCAIAASCAADNCGPITCSQTPAPGTIVTPGTYPITVTISDCASNTVSCTVNFVLTAPPGGCTTLSNCAVQIVCPTNVTAYTCSNSAVVNYPSPTIINPCGSNVFVVCNPPSGSTFPVGITPVTCSVGVAGAVSDQCTFNVIVTTPPNGCPPCTNVVQVFNTGMGGALGNVLLPAGTPDPNYSIVVAPGACNTAQVINTNTMPAPPWVGTGPNSQWIGGGPNAVCDQGFYIYRLAVNVTCPTGAVVSGQWTADDFAGVYLNGTPTGITAPSPNFPYSFTGWHPLRLTNGFICGTNFIDFYVTNAHASPNPTGFRAELTHTYNVCCGPCTTTNCAVRIVCPTNINVVTCSNSAVVNYAAPTIINPCGSNVVVVCNPPSGSTFPVGTTAVICSVGNAAGVVSDQCSFNVTVGPPASGCATNCAIQITCPTNITVLTCSNNAVVNYLAPTVTNPCGSNVVVFCNPPSGSTFPAGTTVVTCSVGVAGAISAQCSFSVTVSPPPTGCCTNVVQVFNTGMGGASGNVPLPAGTPDPNYFLVSAPGACTTAQVINPGTLPGQWVANGPNSQWIGGGPNASCDAGFYHYRLAINITCPSNTVLSGQWTADDFGEVFLNGQQTGYTAPSTNYPWSFTGWQPITLTNGFVCGTNFIDFYVTNAHGVVNPTGFRAELTNVFDSCCTPCTPTNCVVSIQCPTNITTFTCSNSAVVNYPMPTLINPCGSNVSVICNPPSGSTFPIGTTPVTCFVGDATGTIMDQCTFTVTVISSFCDFFNGDFSQPVPTNGTGNGWTSSGLFSGAGWDPTEGNPAPSFLLNNVGDPTTDPTVSQRLCCFQPGQCYTIRGQRKVQAWFGNTNNSFAVLLDGAPILQLPVPTNPPDTNWHDFSVSFTATAPCHNIAFAAEINGTDVSYWIDNLRIECCTTNNCVSIICSTNRTVQTCTNGRPVNYTAPIASSNCGTPITSIVCIPPSGSFFPLGTTTVTCTATDVQGNSASCSFLVIVTGDTTPPNCPPFSMSITGCPPRMPNFQTNGLVTDNCTPSGLISVSQNIPPGTPLSPGTTVVILTICDANGNCRVCDVVITAYSSGVPPKIKCPKDLTVITCSNSAVVNYNVAANVPAAFINCVPPSGSVFPLGTNLVVCTASNACGDSVSCSFKVIVKYGLSVNPNVTITAGLPDNFALPVDTAFRTACLTSAFSGFTGWKSFDAPQDNRIFGHRFTGLPTNIVQAELVIRMKPGGDSGSDNDGLFLGTAPGCPAGSWGSITTIKTIATAVPPTGGTWIQPSNGPTTFTINLSALVWLSKLNTDGFLDIAVHDDTIVDWARLRLWTCPPKQPGVGIPWDTIGTATVAVHPAVADDPKDLGPSLIVSPNPDPTSPPSGVQLDPGSPSKVTFTTQLSFDSPPGSTLELTLPPDGTNVNGALLTFRKCEVPGCVYDLNINKRMFVSDTGNLRSVAIGTNGHLYSSFAHAVAEPDLENFVRFNYLPGVTSVWVTVEFDTGTRDITLSIPDCIWTPDAGRKGWDGCIYGNGTPSKGLGTNKTHAAKLVVHGEPLVPRIRLSTVPFALVARGISEFPVMNPNVEVAGRKWGDGHVTLMKAYDDGESAAERRIEWTSFGEGGGVHVDLGRAATLRVGIHHFENGDIPNEEQVYRIIGPLALTNRPTPPTIPLRVAKGPSGDEYSVDFTDVGAEAVRVELWNDGVLVGAGQIEGSVIPPEGPLIVSGRHGLVSLPFVNEAVIALDSVDLFTTSGLVGNQLRFIAIRPPNHDPLPYYSGLEILTSEGMESMAYGLERTLACTPGPLKVERTSTDTTITWTEGGFRLQGAENVTGPWYDLGADSPVILSVTEPLRYFRLICD